MDGVSAADVPVAILCGGAGPGWRRRPARSRRRWSRSAASRSSGTWIRISRARKTGASCCSRVIWGAWRSSRPRETWLLPSRSECIDTGRETRTGGRAAQVADRLPARRLCLTYADGVADIDLADKAARPRESGCAAATMTVVEPIRQSGIAPTTDAGERVTGFREKPWLDYWITRGFFVCEPAFLDVLEPEGALQRLTPRAIGGRRAPRRLSPRRLLGLHGHLQGRGHAQRSLGRRTGPRGGSGTASPSALRVHPAGCQARRWSPERAGSSAPGWRGSCSSGAGGSFRWTGDALIGPVSTLALLEIADEVVDL